MAEVQDWRDLMTKHTIENRINDIPKFLGDILVCGDDSMNQQVITAQLSEMGLTSIIANNGKIGVELVESRMKCGSPFDLILMDILIESGELTKAFASAWANKNVSGQSGSVSAISNEYETQQPPSTSKYLPGVASCKRNGKGVQVNSVGQ